MNQEELTQEKVDGILYQYQMYQQEVEAISQRLNITEMSLGEIERAIEVTDRMNNVEKGDEILIPIGAESFVHGVLAKPDTVIIGVGSGVCIAKTTEEAKEELIKRKQEIVGVIEQLKANLSQITAELKKTKQVLAQIQQQQNVAT
ncbi:MAG: prefoldin alpha subunit [Candidatus Argoarchaeum ethanivorans]|uniref:Prefoldin subunit alpha n=1 Tax=Candidatus Argoarchaeum ethanivorans TaxID=2608793 RepID=A0A8B3S307_9EURY|nr:MAG: prefoldin alpha subunit [Candidatus Argoarchaeum ethanivorans]